MKRFEVGQNTATAWLSRSSATSVVVEMDAVAHQRTRAEQAEARVDRGIARIVGKQPLHGRDLVVVFVEMGLHQHGRKFLQQRARAPQAARPST